MEDAVTGFEPGQVFAGHRIVRRIATGGMGVVYEAVDEHLRRNVALKVITSGEAGDARFRRRFVREARLLAEFDHPHVLPVFHAGEDEGLPYLTMRLAEGGSLRGLIDRERGLLPGHALRLLSQVADALDALHRRDVAHLDVKPENILLEGPAGDERVWLADLGLARSGADPAAGPAEPTGTTDYMAPEQWRDAGPAADVYAFALVLYEALTGGPLDRGNPPRVTPALRPVFERALAHDPGERQTSAGAVLDQARAALTVPAGEPVAVEGGSIAGDVLLSSAPPRAPFPWRRAAMIGVPVLACAVAVWGFWPSAAPPPSAPRPAASTLLVCAQHLTVRQDPSRQEHTKVLATLAPGDSFVVEGAKGSAWVYGHSAGSATVTGWALRHWLRTRCS